MRGLFVTGTDTGAGKSVLSAALLAAIAAAGERVRAFKPVVTGLAEPPDGDAAAWPPDHELLASAAGMPAREVAPLRFGPAVSPHLAAELAGARVDPRALLEAARASAREGTLIAEGVGGLLVPLCDGWSVCDFACALELDVLIAARPGLGTINHTLLTLRAARAAGLRVRAVVLTPWPAQPSPLERSNRETLARLGEVDVHALPDVGGPDVRALARAGAALPWRRWIADDGAPRADAPRELAPARGALAA
jgi:dethiobiotin synthetase